MSNIPSSPKILAIESSCDETAVAILLGPNQLLASLIFSQAQIHNSTGGVVPEVASREHLARIPSLVRTALEQANLSPHQLDVIAATLGPGLAPALLVGMAFAKGFAISANKPFLAINHIEGHLLSPFFGCDSIPQHIALIVSGGHTLLLRVIQYRQYHLLGKTLDDAAGEAFDKGAKLLGLGYPGGPALSKLAATGDPTSIHFPRSLLNDNSLDFSFSGLKTALRRHLEKNPPRSQPEFANLCASYQEAIVDVLVEKLHRALHIHPLPTIAISGGVAANLRLQQRLRERFEPKGIQVRFPLPNLLTDNAAMIAFAAYHKFLTNPRPDWDQDVFSRLTSDHSFLCIT